MQVRAGRMPRDQSIDVVRGLAIVSMIYANSAGYILAEPHSLASRLFGTFAAPLFILVAGMMVGLSCDVKNYGLRYFFLRGLLVILVAAVIIDVFIWKRVPFVSMEVLYLIGIAIPLTALLHRCSLLNRISVTLLVFATAPLLRSQLGYEEQPWYFDLPLSEDMWPFLRENYLKQQFIDGAFPLFPWLGFAFAGSLLATYRWNLGKEPSTESCGQLQTCHSRNWLVGSFLLLVGDGLVWWFNPGPLYVRMGFSEMFYPPTTGYILTSFGVIGFLFWMVDGNPERRIYAPIRLLGQCSLFVYILQWIIAEHVLYPAFPEMTATPLQHFLWYVGVVGCCVAAAFAANVAKRNWSNMPFAVRFLLGS